jgi:drug/metabolite transporter (DMT)-like permease
MSLRGAAPLRILAAAALFSTGGAAIKACSLTAWQVASFRSGVAALAILVMLPGARRRWGWRTVAVGFAYAATMILYVSANKLTTAANAIFLQSTAPLYLLLLGPLLLREPIRKRDVPFMVTLAVGMALFFAGAERVYETAPHPFAGNVVGALSGVSWALTVAGLRWMARGEGGAHGADGGPEAAARAVFAGNVMACLVCLPLSLPVVDASLRDWTVIGYLGVFQIGLAYVLLTIGVRHVPALQASLLLLLEPVLNPVWAWIVHGERPGLSSLVGGAIILVSTAVKALSDARR